MDLGVLRLYLYLHSNMIIILIAEKCLFLLLHALLCFALLLSFASSKLYRIRIKREVPLILSHTANNRMNRISI